MERIIAGLIFVVVLANFVTFSINTAYSWDEAVYLSMGESAYKGDAFCNIGGKQFDLIDCSARSRYFVYLLGGSFSFFGINYSSTTFFMAILSALTVLVSYLLFKKLFNKEKALLATLFIATNYMFIFFSHRIMTEIISTLLLVISLYFFFELLNNKFVKLIPLFISLGFTIMFRFNFVVIPISIVLYLILFERKLIPEILKSKYFYFGLALFLAIISPQFLVLEKNIEYAATTSFIPFHYFILFIPAAGILAPYTLYGIYLFFRGKGNSEAKGVHKKYIKFLVFFLLIFFLVTGYRLLSIRYLAPIIPVFAILGVYFLDSGKKVWIKTFALLAVINIVIGYLAIIQYIAPISEIDKFPEFISRKSYFDANNVRKDIALDIRDNTGQDSVILTNAPAWVWVYTHRNWDELPDNETEFIKKIEWDKNIEYLYVEPSKPYLYNNSRSELLNKTVFIELYKVRR